MLNKLGRMVRTLQQRQSEKSLVRRQLLSLAGEMAPGWYRIERKLASRIGVSPPKSLVAANNLRSRRGSLVVPPYIEYIPESVANKSGYEHLFITALGDTKLFSSQRKSVQIHMGDQVRLERILEGHRTMGQYLPVTPLRIVGSNAGNLVLDEPFVSGRLFHQSRHDDQVLAYRQLLEGFAELTVERAGSPLGHVRAEQMVQFALDVEIRSPFHSELRKNARELIRLLSCAPVVPSHGDLTVWNVLLDGKDPTILDLELYGHRVFFFDAFTLVLSAMRHGSDTLMKSVLAGDFDLLLDAIFQAAGVGSFSGRKRLVLLGQVVSKLYHRFHNRPNLDQEVVQNWLEPLEIMFHDS